MRHKLVTPLVVVSVAFVAAGGFIHLREWLDTYRDLPSMVPGAEVVKIGFPVNAAASLVAVVALGVAVVWKAGWLRRIVGVVAAFQAGSLAALVISRNGTLFGWTEPVWTAAAEQTLAVGIGALVALGALLFMDTVLRRGAVGYPQPA